MTDWNEEKRKAGFWPTPFLRFINRSGHVVLQQKWNEILTGKEGVWYDVPLAEDETEAGDPLGR